MGLASTLASATGSYYGTGDGVESGPFVARIVISSLPGGAVAVDYEATSREQGVQHLEHSILCTGADGRDRLFIAHSESPCVTALVESESVRGRFEQPDQQGPYTMAVVVDAPSPGELTYAWWWSPVGSEPVEQSKAYVRRYPPDGLSPV
jgi:hypothetical protein